MSGKLTCNGKTGASVVAAAVSALTDFKNPYVTGNAAVTNGGNNSADADVGYVRVSASGNTLTIKSCNKTACSKPENQQSSTVEVE